MYEKACKLVYRIAMILLAAVVAVLAVGFLVVVPIKAIVTVSEAFGCEMPLYKAALIYLLTLTACAAAHYLYKMAAKGSEIVERENKWQKLLIIDIARDKLWFGFYHQDKKTGRTERLAEGESDDKRISECFNPNGVIIDTARLASLLHQMLLFSSMTGWSFNASDKKYSRAVVRMHIPNTLSEKHKEKIGKVLSNLNLSLYLAENADKAERKPLSGEEAYARYGDWRKG